MTWEEETTKVKHYYCKCDFNANILSYSSSLVEFMEKVSLELKCFDTYGLGVGLGVYGDVDQTIESLVNPKNGRT